MPRKLAKGELGKHYRWGWEEKEKAGKELVPGITDLPNRMPGTEAETLNIAPAGSKKL